MSKTPPYQNFTLRQILTKFQYFLQQQLHLIPYPTDKPARNLSCVEPARQEQCILNECAAGMESFRQITAWARLRNTIQGTLYVRSQRN